MASILLPLAAGSALSSAGIVATSLLYTAGTAAAGLAGSLIDSALLNAFIGPTKNSVTGPRLNSTPIQSSMEGAPIYRAFGRNRIAGQVFWSTRFREVETTTTSSQGGKGSVGGIVGGGGSSETTQTTFQYYVSMAVGLCEGPIVRIGRVWADNNPFDLTNINYRVYVGTETQTADPKIVAVEGADYAPAYKGLAYIVFEDLLLEDFGNRIPQFNFEVFSFATEDSTELEHKIYSVNYGTGLGEYAYALPVVRTKTLSAGVDGLGWNPSELANADTEIVENGTGTTGQSDCGISVDDSRFSIPSLDKGQVTVSWFGTDLRCANCQIRPAVETRNKVNVNFEYDWWSGGLDRQSAELVSRDSTGAVMEGTPSDYTVLALLQNLKARGMRTALYPKIVMDIPSTNVLPNPADAGVSYQPFYPDPALLTIFPGIGASGSPDKTSAVVSQLETFFGTAVPGYFGSWNNYTIPYGGPNPNEWSYRRFILHYAKLAAASGACDMFYIGAGLEGLTAVRMNSTTFPTVAYLKDIASVCRSILGPTVQITYAANWAEWNNYTPDDASNDVFFHLDPLWTDTNIDCIAIRNFAPITDWRDLSDHLDAQLTNSIYDQTYLQSNIEGGEYYDWKYTSTTNRVAQTRTNITDSVYGKAWVYRRKDLYNWWNNLHYDRPSGVENGSPTSWTIQSKPIIFADLGCPAIDKGSNKPDAVYDPKTTYSSIPYFSTGARDDYIQRAYIQAWIEYYAIAGANNPSASGYTGYMLDVTNISVTSWDIRPFPAFPTRSDLWRDTILYQYGTWINGRLGQVTLADIVKRITQNLGVSVDVGSLYGLVTGYMLDRIMSPRESIEPLSGVYLFDSFESAGQIKFRHRGGQINWILDETDLVPVDDNGSTYTIARKQETDLPQSSIIKYVDEVADYQQGAVQSSRLIGSSNRVSESSIAVVSTRERMQQSSDLLLMDAWIQREQINCVLPPSLLAADVTDVIQLTLGAVSNEYRIEELDYSFPRAATLTRTDKGLYYNSISPASIAGVNFPKIVVSALIDFVELPILADAEAPGGPYLALYSKPWISNVVYRSPITSDYTLDTTVLTPAKIGTIDSALAEGPEQVWDYTHTITVQMYSDTILESKDELSVLSGKNAAAIKCINGEWEIIQWVNATLVDVNKYQLTKLLRAQLGTDEAMRAGAASGAQFVLLDNLPKTSVGPGSRGVTLNWKYGPSSRAISDSSYKTVQYAPTVIGQRPYSPTHLAATKDPGTTDITMTWYRRSRLPQASDNWDNPDPPLGEESEAYEIDIYNAAGDTLLRTLTSTTTSVVYTAAMQTADFGSSQTFVDFKVFQMSSSFGRGTGRRKKITGM